MSTIAESEMMSVNFYDITATSMTTSTYESPADEIRRLAAAIGIKDVVMDEETNQYTKSGLFSKMPVPLDVRYSVDLGRCPISWHFYGATRAIAQDKALTWLRKPKTGCVCSW